MTAETQRAKLEQIQALNAFLATFTALDTKEKKFEKYVLSWQKLHTNQQKAQKKWSTKACKDGDLGELVQKIANLRVYDARQESFSIEMSMHHPWTQEKLDFWKAFSVFIEKDLREVAVNRGCRRKCPPNSKWYNTQLITRIDTYLASLDIFIDIQQQIDKAHNEDNEELEYTEKNLKKDQSTQCLQMANDFLQVILFLYAVPQEVPLQVKQHKYKIDELIPPLKPSDVDMDVTWMYEDCKWYQQNKNLMKFVTDCAVLALMSSSWYFSPAFTEICQSYQQIESYYQNADTYEVHVSPQQVLPDDLVHKISDSVRRDGHRDRARRNSGNETTTSRALLDLKALCNEL